MRRTTPHYGVQGPDALLLSVVIFLLGAFGFIAGVYCYLSVVLFSVGGSGIFLLCLVSSYSYRTGLRDHILELCPPQDNDLVLDIGTGRGLLAIGFAKSGCNAVGMDIWSSQDLLRNHPAKALRNAELEGVGVSYLTGDALRIPFKGSSFDLVVSCDMVHNLHSGRKAKKMLTEMGRVLKVQGRLLICDLNPFFGPGWSKGRWRQELAAAGFGRIELGDFRLTTVISGERA